MTRRRQKAQISTRNVLRPLVKREQAPSNTSNDLEKHDKALIQRDPLAHVLLRKSKRHDYRQSVNDQKSSDLVEFQHDASTGRDVLSFVRYSLEPFSDKLDPFAQLPVALDRFQEHLVSFYLLDYPKVTYGLSPHLKPHPVATNFSIAINNPPNFQVALARSALYRISLKKYNTESEKHDLEVALMKHKGEALRMVKEMSAKADGATDKDNLVASIISLGTLDNRTGAKDTASMHFMAVRRLLRSIGGPLGIKSALLSRVMVHFECIYGTTTASYVWDHSDASRLLLDINCFFADVWDLWKSPTRRSSIVSSTGSTTSTSSKMAISTTSSASISPVAAFALRPDSSLREALSRPHKQDDEEITTQDRMKLTFQLTCLLTFCHMILDYASDPGELKRYLANLNCIIDNAQLTGQPCNNHLWLMQVHDQSSTHNTRIWRAASFVWLLRHVPYSVQKGIRDWLLAFATGQSIAARTVKRLDAFYFSYAMQPT